MVFSMRLDISTTRWTIHLLINCQSEGKVRTTPWKEPQARQEDCSWVCCKTIGTSSLWDILLKTRIMHVERVEGSAATFYHREKLRGHHTVFFKHTFSTWLKVLEYEKVEDVTFYTLLSLSLTGAHALSINWWIEGELREMRGDFTSVCKNAIWKCIYKINSFTP